MKRMKAVDLMERPVLSGEAVATPGEVAYPLNVAGVYQDSVTRGWAFESYLQTAPRVDKDHIRNTWYDVNSLSDPQILLEAVHTTRVADVIVISVHAADDLPLNLYAWIAAWLPRRLSRAGALAAMVGVAEPLDSPSLRTLKYLQAVARRAQLDFIPQPRRWTGASILVSKPVAVPATADLPSLQDRNGQRYFAYYHCGLNE
jgi:hypothetical protein